MSNLTSRQPLHVLVVYLASAGTVSAQESPRFPSFAEDHAPPADHAGMVFELSQDYPTAAPREQKMPWDSINFFTRDGALKYARAVLRYGVEGNVEVDWVVQNNQVRKWYHAPWMHPDCTGREFVRGMTRERTLRPYELHPQQSEWCDNWAVGFYNPPGGYTLGQVWQDADDPDPSRATFPHGTVGMKLLFTTATVEEAPFLEGSLEWTANVYPRSKGNPCDPKTPEPARKDMTLRLLQIDVAVRDKRKDRSTGWVFATFIYDGSSDGTKPFDRMQPVGLMWADDSDVTTDMNRPGAYVNDALHDGFLNPDLIGDWDPNDPTKVRLVHAGLGGRLNGPVDNPISSCMSCHGRAGVPSQDVTPDGIDTPEQYTEEAFRQFFSDVPHGAGTWTGPKGEYARLDYSLQLAVGIRNFQRAHPQPETLIVSAAIGPEVSRGEGESERRLVAAPTAAAKPATIRYLYYVAAALLLVVIVVVMTRRKKA